MPFGKGPSDETGGGGERAERESPSRPGSPATLPRLVSLSLALAASGHAGSCIRKETTAGPIRSFHRPSGGCGEKDGIPLPCWRDFLGTGEGEESLPSHPYAKRPNGCSVPGSTPGARDSFTHLGRRYDFKPACDAHDSCYYTSGSSADACNRAFEADLRAACSRGAINPIGLEECWRRASSMFVAVKSTQGTVHWEAQKTQRAYEAKVEAYVSEERRKASSGDAIRAAPTRQP